MAKTAFRRGTTDRKRRKSAFGHGRRAENSKNSVSAAAESLKMKKMRFGHGRKTENGENSISATAETEIMPQKRLSNPLGMGKKPQNGFPTSWKQERQMLQLNSHE